MAYRVEPLGKQHDRSTFSCGTEALDRYLRQQARQDERKRVAAPFVLCEGSSNEVLGYYTLSALSIEVGAWPLEVARKLPKYPLVPTTLLGRLAVDTRLRGKGAGEHLLMGALRRVLEASREVASVAVVVDAKDESAVAFYRHYGFVSFADEPRRLFLPTAVLEKLFG
ncbi:MAG: GNAT family N-acetyltransferase [Candidatus Rokubacteria bacterium]|nr:GNAT family N-acetyltransferase [Candidatus Rokubacteria bacterium]